MNRSKSNQSCRVWMISNACWGIMRDSLDIKRFTSGLSGVKASDPVTSPKNEKMSKFPITRVRTVLWHMAFRQSSRASTTNNMCCVHLQHLQLHLFPKDCSLTHCAHPHSSQMLASANSNLQMIPKWYQMLEVPAFLVSLAFCFRRLLFSFHPFALFVSHFFLEFLVSSMFLESSVVLQFRAFLALCLILEVFAGFVQDSCCFATIIAFSPALIEFQSVFFLDHWHRLQYVSLYYLCYKICFHFFVSYFCNVMQRPSILPWLT